jgi:hypothetical protein
MSPGYQHELWTTLSMAAMAGVTSSPTIKHSSSTAATPNGRMQAASIKLSQKALQQIENRIDKASAPQAAMVYGILRDKERLDAGEATEIVATHSRVDISGLDKLAAALSQTLLQKEIDVTPTVSGTTKAKRP